MVGPLWDPTQCRGLFVHCIFSSVNMTITKHRNDFITQSRKLLGGKVEPLLYALLDVLNYCYEQNQLERLAREVGYMFLA